MSLYELGFTAESAVAAVQSRDWSLLKPPGREACYKCTGLGHIDGQTCSRCNGTGVER